jgi:hypothetical protein
MSKLDFVSSDCEDLGCHTGATFLVTVQCFQACITDMPVDLTGYTATLQVYDEVETVSVINVTGTITAPTTGIIQFLISAHDTGHLTVGMYSYNINLSIGSNIFRMAYGTFEVSE